KNKRTASPSPRPPRKANKIFDLRVIHTPYSYALFLTSLLGFTMLFENFDLKSEFLFLKQEPFVRKIFCTILTAAILPATAWSLPIDWHGVFGVDTTLIDSYRRIKSTTDNSALNNGTQEVAFATGNQANASFQSYVFRLSPTIIVNDSASLKGELTTNYGRGGRFGDDTTRSGSNDAAFGSALYVHNNSGGDDLLVNQLYAELYSDAATWQIGRHSYEWGLGAVF